MSQLKVPCELGLNLLSALRDKRDMMSVLLEFKGVERIEQLSREEIETLNQFSEAINKAIFSPKSVDLVRLEFPIEVRGEEYLVCLGDFSELDITLQSVEMLEDFNPSQVERVPMYIACVYAPIIRAMLDLEIEDGKLAHIVSEAIKKHLDFADVYAIFDFFVWWKVNYTKGPLLSFRRSMRLYRRRRNQTMFLRKHAGRFLRRLLLRSLKTREDSSELSSIEDTLQTPKNL